MRLIGETFKRTIMADTPVTDWLTTLANYRVNVVKELDKTAVIVETTDLGTEELRDAGFRIGCVIF